MSKSAKAIIASSSSGVRAFTVPGRHKTTLPVNLAIAGGGLALRFCFLIHAAYHSKSGPDAGRATTGERRRSREGAFR